MTAQKSARSLMCVRQDTDHDDVGIEGTHRLDANELETELTMRELFNRAQCGVSRHTKIAEWAGDAFGTSRNRVTCHPFQFNDRRAHGIRRPLKVEAGEAQTASPGLLDARAGTHGSREGSFGLFWGEI